MGVFHLSSNRRKEKLSKIPELRQNYVKNTEITPKLCQKYRNYAKLCQKYRNYTKLCQKYQNYAKNTRYIKQCFK